MSESDADVLRRAAALMRKPARSTLPEAFRLALADLLDLTAGHKARRGDECGIGWHPATRQYGDIDPSCAVCGTPDEYAEPWPCETARRGLAVAHAYLDDA